MPAPSCWCVGTTTAKGLGGRGLVLDTVSRSIILEAVPWATCREVSDTSAADRSAAFLGGRKSQTRRVLLGVVQPEGAFGHEDVMAVTIP